MKLIKLSDTHYIVADGSEIKEGDFVFQQNFERTNNQIIRIETEFQAKIANDKDGSFTKRKISHSTQPLEDKNEEYSWYGGENNIRTKVFDKLKPLSLSEVEELISGYSVEKMAENSWDLHKDLFSINSKQEFLSVFKTGFKAHKELVKDKLFTVDDMKIALSEAFKASQEGYQITSNEIIQSLLPKEWSVKFDEQGKLKLI